MQVVSLLDRRDGLSMWRHSPRFFCMSAADNMALMPRLILLGADAFIEFKVSIE